MTAYLTAGEGTAVLTGELDVTSVPLLRARLRVLTLARPQRLVVDAAGITFLDVGAARVLVTAGRRPVIRSPSPAVRLVLGLAHLDSQCEFED